MNPTFQKKLLSSNEFTYELKNLNFKLTHNWARDKLINDPSLNISKKSNNVLCEDDFSFLAFLPKEIPQKNIYDFEHAYGNFTHESEHLMVNFFNERNLSKKIILCEDWTIKRNDLKYCNSHFFEYNFKDKIPLHGDDFYCYDSVHGFLTGKIPSRLNGSACYTFQGFLIDMDFINLPQEISDKHIEYLSQKILSIIFLVLMTVKVVLPQFAKTAGFYEPISSGG